MDMKKTKFRSYALTALLVLLALVLSAAIGSLNKVRHADAADYRPASLFSAGTGGSIVASEEEGDGKYVKFELSDNGKVHYRRDLALKWYAAAPEAASETVGKNNRGKLYYFSLDFQFVELNFTHFSLSFESAEENVSKDETSKNTIHFYKGEDGALTAAVQNASEQKDGWKAEEPVSIELPGNNVALRFSEDDCSIGEFAVYINETRIGKLTNIGGYFMEYLSSASSTPRIPITFLADDVTGDGEKLGILIKEMNGQSFALNADDRVEDNAPAALVVNERVHSYMLGKSWSLTYEAIDVCDDSVTVTRKFAMVKTDEGGAYLKPTDEDYDSLTTSTYFMPTSDQTEKEEQYVSIYFSLDDGTERSEEETAKNYVYLSWYAEENAVASCGEGENAFDYIKVDRLQGGPEYVGIKADADTRANLKEDLASQRAEEYQNAVDEASRDLSAGKGSYFYLPSLRGLIESEYADYRNLRFSIYYRKQSDEVDSTASSSTALRYNGLRFEITEEGKYVFKVLAEDSVGNAMVYYYEDKLQKVTADNLWEIEEIPEFYFEASYSGVKVEKPGSQTLGYSGQSYTFSDFEIVGLDGYETKYTLYRMNVEEASKELSIPGYSTMVDDPATYFERFKSYMTVIKPYNDSVTEEDEDRWNSTFNAYEWRPDEGLTFTPQQKAYYFLKLEVTESRLPGHSEVAYQVIDVQNSVDQLPDSPDWLENNLTSVILFSISAALLIVVIIIFVAKPSEKTVEEIDLESLKGKGGKGTKKGPDEKEE